MVDFNKLNSARSQSTPTDPLRIFQRLPKPPHINDLWESQSEALKIWTQRRAESDLVIKLNTGGGKTLVGLLIGQALLHELRQPVLYLCPNNQLVRQAVEKATEVGITTRAYERGPGNLPADFLNAAAILVATYHALFNGRSKFGVLGGGTEPVKVGRLSYRLWHKWGRTPKINRLRDKFVPACRVHRAVDGCREIITATEVTAWDASEAHRLVLLADAHHHDTKWCAATVVADDKYVQVWDSRKLL